MPGLKVLIAPEIMVDLRGHFSKPEALIEALEEMEEVLTGSADREKDGPMKQALVPHPN